MARRDVTDDMVVAAARARQANPRGPFVDEILAERTGQPRKVCERAIERALLHGVVEAGVSTRTCWPAE